MSADATLRRLGAVATEDLGPVIEEALDTMTTSHKRLKAINKDWNRFCAKQQVEDNVVFDAQKTRSILTKAAELKPSMDHLETCVKQAQSETKHKMEMVTKNNVDLQRVLITTQEAQLAIMLFDTGLANNVIQKIIDKDTEQRIKQNLDGQASGPADTQQDVFKRTIEASEEIVNLKSELKMAGRENQRLKTKVQETQKQLDDAEEKATIETRKLEQRIEVLQSEQSDSSLRDIISRLEQEKLLLDKELKMSEAQVSTSNQTIQTVLDSKKQTLDRRERIMEENKSRVQEMEDWCRRTFQQDIDLLKKQKVDLKTQLDGANAEISKLKHQLGAKTTELSASNDCVSQLEKAHAEKVQGLDIQLSLSKRRVGDLEKDLEKKTTELSSSEKRVSNLQQQLEDAQTANVKTVQRLGEDLSASKECVHGLEKDLEKAQASLQADLQVIEEKTKKLSALEAQLATSEGRVRNLEKSLEEAQASLQADLQVIEEKVKNLSVLEAQLAISEGRVHGLEKDLEKAQATSLANLQLAEEKTKELSASEDQTQKLTTSYSELHANVEHCVAFLNDYTGYRLPMDSWIRALHLAISPIEGDVDSYDGVTKFWDVQDTWGNGRSTYWQDSAGTLHSCLSLYAVLMSRPDGMDWMNLALLHASNLLADMIDEPQKIYRGLLVEITNMVVRMVNEHILHQNDPLLLSVWQILTYANDMTQKSLAMAIVSLVEVHGGQLTKLVTAITSGPSGVQALCNQEESGIYYDVSEVGVLLDRDMGTNEQWYILLDFADRVLRVVVGKRWKFSYVNGPSIQFSGNEENTTYTFKIQGSGPWWFGWT